MRVSLTWSEVTQAAVVAVMRQVANIRDGRKDAHGLGPTTAGWGIHVEGCCGEMAAAKALGVFWTGALGNLRSPDIGQRIQVRASTLRDARLILHKDDDDAAAFVLVIGTIPEYLLAGWVLGADGKQESYWTDPKGGRPAYFVPQARLRPMSTLTGWKAEA